MTASKADSASDSTAGDKLPVSSASNVALSEEEKAVYDRQIRLWGLEAQNRLRNSTVLIAGLSGCGAEVAKNLVLAGLKSLTLLDHTEVSEKDESNQFLIAPGSRGKNRAEASRNRCHVLNPHVALHVDTSNVLDKTDDYFKQFDLVILIDQKYSLINRVDKICRDAHIRFAAGGVYGWTGYGFFDFNDHIFLLKAPKRIIVSYCDGAPLNTSSLNAEQFSPKKKRLECGDESAAHVNVASEQTQESIDIGDDDDELIKTSVAFPSWEDALNVDWTQKKLIRKSKRILPNCYFPIRALLRASDESNGEVDEKLIVKLWKEEMAKCNRNFEMQSLNETDAAFFTGPQLTPACAIVGAVIGQEAIKALSQNDEPLRNLFLYSALETAGLVCNFPPIV